MGVLSSSEPFKMSDGHLPSSIFFQILYPSCVHDKPFLNLLLLRTFWLWVSIVWVPPPKSNKMPNSHRNYVRAVCSIALFYLRFVIGGSGIRSNREIHTHYQRLSFIRRHKRIHQESQGRCKQGQAPPAMLPKQITIDSRIQH